MADEARYLLGLDAGNTVIKAVLFDLEGRQCAMHALDGRSVTPQPGHVERDLDELWANAREAIRTCIEEAGIDPRAIAAVGCAGHGNGLYLLDRADRALLGIQSLDTRAAGIAAELKAADGAAFHDICRQMPWPAQTPSLLAWVKRQAPDIYERTGTVLLCKDFITFRLTGERVSELSDMSGCGLLHLPDGRYDDGLLALYGLEDARPLLPRLVAPSEIAGTVSEAAAAQTGLVAGTPVVGGLFDVVASAMGSGVVSTGKASIIAGTCKAGTLWIAVRRQIFSTPVRATSIPAVVENTVTILPSRRRMPDAIGRIPAMVLSSVDFPDPLAPMRPSRVP